MMTKIKPSKYLNSPTCVALGYGALAGALAALTLFMMNQLQHLLWAPAWANTPWGIFIIISMGGVILALLHRYYHHAPASDGLDEQLYDSQHRDRRTLLFLALSAIVAVGFGGAIGPEAGLLAVVGQMSTLVSARLKHSHQARQLIHQTGSAAALAGLYASPPAVAMLSEASTVQANATGGRLAETNTPKPIKFLAGFSGMMGFWLMHKALTDKAFTRLPMPEHHATLSDAWVSLPAIGLAMIFGLGFLYLHHYLPIWQTKLNIKPTTQIIAGSMLFGLLAVAVPLVRFSGHHEIEHFLAHAGHDMVVDTSVSVSWLLMLAAAKLLAMALCLVSGWRGGEFFPVLFVGFALGIATHLLLPGVAVSPAIIGAMSGLLVLAMGKPIMVVLVLILFVEVYAPSALFTGVLIGHGVRTLVFKYLINEQHVIDE